MPRTAPANARTRRRAYLSAMALVLAAVTGGATGALGAGSPSEAVETLVDRIVSGGFDDLTGVVCPEFEDDIRAEFDPTASGPTIWIMPRPRYLFPSPGSVSPRLFASVFGGS